MITINGFSWDVWEDVRSVMVEFGWDPSQVSESQIAIAMSTCDVHASSRKSRVNYQEDRYEEV